MANCQIGLNAVVLEVLRACLQKPERLEHVQRLWFGVVSAQRPVQKPVQLAPQWAQLVVQTIHGGLYFHLFAMSGMFRNQQVAGSIPAGGSS